MDAVRLCAPSLVVRCCTRRHRWAAVAQASGFSHALAVKVQRAKIPVLLGLMDGETDTVLIKGAKS